MTDSLKFDMPTDEFQRFLLGFITAGRLGTDTARQYFADTLPDFPDIAEADMPSYLRLQGRIMGALVTLFNAFHDEPMTHPWAQMMLDGLRDGSLFREVSA